MNEALTVAQMTVERGLWWPESWIGRFWVLFGLGAQAIFTLRFLYQWIASEKRGMSFVPIGFWYLSLLGGIMLFIYATFWKHDLVVALGQTTGSFVYIRNLMLLHKERQSESYCESHA